MLHILYILAFTIIAFIAISNLIRSLLTVSLDSQRRHREVGQSRDRGSEFNPYRSGVTLHPELLDKNGKPLNEPLLVMRSVTVEDARQQLDALYNASPNPPKDPEQEN